jgi:tetratricopeptide (TPR) repeat protein
MLAALGRHEEALAAYESALERSANRFNSLHGAGVAAEALGERDVAGEFYRRLLEVAGSSTTRRSVIERLEAFLAQG